MVERLVAPGMMGMMGMYHPLGFTPMMSSPETMWTGWQPTGTMAPMGIPIAATEVDPWMAARVMAERPEMQALQPEMMMMIPVSPVQTAQPMMSTQPMAMMQPAMGMADTQTMMMGMHPGMMGMHPGMMGVHPGMMGMHPGMMGAPETVAVPVTPGATRRRAPTARAPEPRAVMGIPGVAAGVDSPGWRAMLNLPFFKMGMEMPGWQTGLSWPGLMAGLRLPDIFGRME